MKFSEFSFHPSLLEGIESMNYTEATPIQAEAIPLILQKKDVLGIAQTGTGKTAAFVLPLIHHILDNPDAGHTQALIIVPTRELAIQIDTAIEAYSYFTGVSSIAIYGGGTGEEFQREKNAITSGADIIIATPGRLLSHMSVGYVDFTKLRFLVLDEADRLLDMGFIPDLMRIIRATNPDRQTLLFSATMPEGVFSLARSLMRDPVRVNIALSKPAEGVTQAAYVVFDQQKLPLITALLRGKTGESIMVFGSTKQSVSDLYRSLKSARLNVGRISSDLEQHEREEVMMSFRNRQLDVLVATNVVSRGIDIDGIDMVINYDVPADAEEYIHRIGRTARAAKKGTAITLIGTHEQAKFRRIENLIGRDVDKLPVEESFGPTPEYNPKAHTSHGGGGGGGKRHPGGGGQRHSGGGNGGQQGNKRPFFKGNRGPKPTGNSPKPQ